MCVENSTHGVRADILQHIQHIQRRRTSSSNGTPMLPSGAYTRTTDDEDDGDNDETVDIIVRTRFEDKDIMSAVLSTGFLIIVGATYVGVLHYSVRGHHRRC